ncbi:MAG: site-2 protease family protein [Acidobacteria bacterium]|nr:site-2 protease family protein [Acidobacteriota bacterium]
MKQFFQIFKKKLLITHIYSIPVRIDYSWFLLLGIMGWFVSVTIPAALVASGMIRFLLGIVTILVFFISVLLHELAHSFIARQEGIQVIEVILHPFGGLTKLRHEPTNPSAEFKIAAAGPIASFLIAAAFLGLWAASVSIHTDILTPLFLALFVLNLLLAIFNLFPGYPLDGGRVLRAVLWGRGKDLNEATILTGKFGQIIGASLIVIGIGVLFSSGGIFSGSWTIFVGLFLFDSASKVIRQAGGFENLKAEQIMEMAVSVSPETDLMEFVDHILPRYRYTVFPVAEDKEFYGFLLLEDVKRNIPREEWKKTLVRQAMRPIRADYFVENTDSAKAAIDLLQQNEAGAIGVINSSSELVGIIYKGRIRRRT